jgi:hypothetical protein
MAGGWGLVSAIPTTATASSNSWPMKTRRSIPLLISTSILCLGALFANDALAGGSLMAIPTVGADTSNEARAITPDGAYVVGLSGTTVGFFYDVTNNSVVQPFSSDGYSAVLATGVAYRTDTNQSPGQLQVLVSGLDNTTPKAHYSVWMTTSAGASWEAICQGGTGSKPTTPVANGLVGSSSDVFFGTWTDEGPGSGDNWGLNIGEYTGTWVPSASWGTKGASKPALLQMNAIAINGRAAGWRSNTVAAPTFMLVADFKGATTPGLWSPNGLDGTTKGQVYAITPDGTVMFGISPKGTPTGATNYAFKATFDSTFPGPATQLSTSALPDFANTTAEVSLLVPFSTNAAVPYGCTADGKFAVGTSYRGVARAVLWDTSNANPLNWTVTDLTDLASASGFLGNFTNLSRAYSIGTNAAGEKVVVGIGSYTEDAGVTVYRRGFVMVVPNVTPVVRPLVKISTAPQKFTFSVAPTVSGKTYYLEYVTTVTSTSWNPLGSTPGTGGTVTLTDLNPPDVRRYYRVRVQ